MQGLGGTSTLGYDIEALAADAPIHRAMTGVLRTHCRKKVTGSLEGSLHILLEHHVSCYLDTLDVFCFHTLFCKLIVL